MGNTSLPSAMRFWRLSSLAFSFSFVLTTISMYAVTFDTVSCVAALQVIRVWDREIHEARSV
jgi:hypothetical protein